MKRVLLTGGTGFVGANLARRLLRDGHQLHLLVRPGRADWRIAAIRKELTLHEADLRSGEAVSAVVAAARPDWIFHLAVYGAYPAQDDLTRMLETNVLGTANLLQASLARGFDAFVNTGSSSEYGLKGQPPDETSWLEPNSAYAVSKASATLLCRQIAQARRLGIPTLRLYSVFGPYEEPTRLIPTLIGRALAGGLPPLVDRAVARDFVHVDDVVEAYLLAATGQHDEFGAVYNVGSGVQTTLETVVEVARRLIGVSADPEWGTMPRRAWDTTLWVADSRRIRSQLGWAPRYSFEDGLARTIEWFRAAPELSEIYADRDNRTGRSGP